MRVAFPRHLWLDVHGNPTLGADAIGVHKGFERGPFVAPESASCGLIHAHLAADGLVDDTLHIRAELGALLLVAQRGHNRRQPRSAVLVAVLVALLDALGEAPGNGGGGGGGGAADCLDEASPPGGVLEVDLIGGEPVLEHGDRARRRGRRSRLRRRP